VCFDRAPNAAATPPQLRAEIFRHELALSKIGDQKKVLDKARNDPDRAINKHAAKTNRYVFSHRKSIAAALL
jgi:hypothetical protein